MKGHVFRASRFIATGFLALNMSLGCQQKVKSTQKADAKLFAEVIVNGMRMRYQINGPDGNPKKGAPLTPQTTESVSAHKTSSRTMYALGIQKDVDTLSSRIALYEHLFGQGTTAEEMHPLDSMLVVAEQRQKNNPSASQPKVKISIWQDTTNKTFSFSITMNFSLATEDPSYFNKSVNANMPGINGACPDLLITLTYHLNPKTNLISKKEDFRIYFDPIGTIVADVRSPYRLLQKNIVGKLITFEETIFVTFINAKVKAEFQGSGIEFDSPHKVFAIGIKGTLDMVHWNLHATGRNLGRK